MWINFLSDRVFLVAVAVFLFVMLYFYRLQSREKEKEIESMTKKGKAWDSLFSLELPRLTLVSLAIHNPECPEIRF